MSKLQARYGLTDNDIAILRNLRITTTEQLWEAIGKDHREGLGQFAKQNGIAQDHLFDYLATEAKNMAGKRSPAPWLKVLRFALFGLAIITLAVLGFRAIFNRTTIVVAAHDLKKGEQIQSSDLKEGSLLTSEGYFVNIQDVVGAVPVNDINAGKPVRMVDLQRVQVVAITDIPSDTVVTTEMVSSTWSLYQSDALVDIKDMFNYKTLYPIKKGEPVIQSALVDLPKARVVVVKRASGLPALHTIMDGDLDVIDRPTSGDHYTDTKTLKNHYTLRSVAEGAVLRPDDVSIVPIDPVNPKKPYIVSINTRLGGLRASLGPNSIISLIFHKQGSDNVQQVDNIIIIDMVQQGTEDVLLVAIPDEQMQHVQSYLGVSTIIVVRQPQ
jgi:hypothetical protein